MTPSLEAAGRILDAAEAAFKLAVAQDADAETRAGLLDKAEAARAAYVALLEERFNIDAEVLLRRLAA